MATIFEQFMRGRQLAQQSALDQLKMQQAQQAFPIQQQLQQLKLQQAQQNLAMGEQEQQATKLDMQRARLEQGISAAKTLGHLARGAKGLEGEGLSGYIETIRPLLSQVSPELANVQAEEITPELLDSLDIQGKALSRVGGNQVQQAQYVEGLGFVQQLKNGEVQLKELTPDQKQKVEDATRLNAELKADETRKTTEAREGAKTVQSFKTELNANAFESRRFLPKIDRIRKAIEAVQTGKMAQAKKLLGPFIPGVDPSDEQALNTALNDLIFDQLARFTGALSEGERAFASETTTNMGFTTEANLLILDRLEQRAKDAIDEQAQFKEHLKQGGSVDDFAFTPSEEFSLPVREEEIEVPIDQMSDEELMQAIERMRSSQ